MLRSHLRPSKPKTKPAEAPHQSPRRTQEAEDPPNDLSAMHLHPGAHTALNKPTSILYVDATELSFEPKVLVPFEHQRGRVPRKIEVERRRRLYESQDMSELLTLAGLEPTELIKRSHHHLPLEVFDDTSFDCRDAEEWMRIARSAPQNEGQFLPARAFKQSPSGMVSMEPCRVVSWNESNNKLSVFWGSQKTSNESPDFVSRIFVHLLAEDPVVFVQRLVNAERQRVVATSWIKYRLCCDSMPTEGLAGIEPSVAVRLRKLGTGIPLLAKERFPQVEERMDKLLGELDLEWRRTHNRLLFQHELQKDEGLQKIVQNTTKLSLANVIDGPNGPSAQRDERPMRTVSFEGYDYAEREKQFTFSTYFTQEEVVRALTGVRNECIKVLERSLFRLPKTRQMPLVVFEQMQKDAMTEMTQYLTTDWKDNIVAVVKECFKSVGKGWLNINEGVLSVYEESKLKRFFTTVKYMMEDTLFELVYTSLSDFTTFFEEVCDFDVHVEDMNNVKNSWPGSDAADAVEKQPLFTIDLVEKEGGFVYSTQPDRFLETIIALFNGAIRCTTAIPQLEKFVMTQYFWKRDGDGPFLDTVKEEEERVCGLRDRVTSTLKSSLSPLESYIRTYDELLDVARLSKAAYIKQYAEEEHSNEDMKEEIRRHIKAKKAVTSKIPTYIAVGNFVIDCQSLALQLANKNQDLAKLVMDLICRIAKQKTATIREEFTRIVKIVEKAPQNAEKLYDTKQFIAALPEKVAELREAIEDMRIYYNILEGFQYGLSDDDFRHKWESIGWPRQLDIRVEQAQKELVKTEEELHSRMQKDMEDFQKRVDTLQRVVATFSKYTDSKEADKVAAEVKTHGIEIKRCIEEARNLNNDQRLFGDTLTDYRNVFDLEKEFKPYSDLWLTTYTWQDSLHKWHTDPFDSIDPDEVDQTVQTTQKIMIQLAKTFKDKNAMLKIVEDVRNSVDGFKPVVPLVIALRNQGMKERHWQGLSEKLGKPIAPGENLHTVTDCHDLIPFRDVIVSHCEVAAKEYGIEKSLNDMKAKWANRNLIIEAYKESKTYIVKDVSEIIELLDDHLNTTQQLQFSHFKAHFEPQINEWERDLNLMSDILEQWMECQRSWRYLQPIFESEDIAMQLPKLHKMFDKVDRQWRKMMASAHQTPNCHTFCTSGVKVLEVFRDCNRLLEEVQKGLNDYLQDKRQCFPRFYFLSDEELLEILSQSKDVRRIDDHIKKLFEFIARMKWRGNENIMEGFYSSEKEYIPFTKPLNPEGNVETWLREVELMMKEAVHKQVQLAYEDYTKEARRRWVLKWPGQAVIAIAQVFWTAECESELSKRGNVQQYATKLDKQLMELVDVVQGTLTNTERINTGALITIEVHAKDTIDNMSAAGVSAATSFDWMKQLRFYMESDNFCHIRQVDAHFIYGGEYLGNTGRLVVTPLTDRIYLTLTGALSLCLGGAPAGPAGTGKTETTKDLAKALAKQCVVFNCQEGMTYISMGKFFKGLAWSGAWACFDEFNRIDVEVLSVVAQQVTDLQQACITKQYRIVFEESDLVVDPTYAIFITMNPGYAGRTELPDNLKVLFRPVACMVPDYALIGEIRLFSYGYKKARALAQKMVMTFKLSSEQLSSQDHYDFGMRAVNTVISAAGLNKRERPNEDEDILLLRALRDSNLPKFLKDDIVLFEGIISDLFPGVVLPPANLGSVKSALEASVRDHKIQAVPAFISKCLQLYDVTTLRHGLMLVGPTGSGKTSAYRVLQDALSSIALRQQKGENVGERSFQKVYTHLCNPKAVTMDQLYGAYDENGEWKDGVLCILFRRAAKYGDEGNLQGLHWVLFDGPVDALWIESMNTVLDDNKKLCLVSGEIIQMNRDMTMLFEVEDLAVASPATVSRCGMIYMEPETCAPTAARVQSWIESIPKHYKCNVDVLQDFATKYLDPMITYVRRNLKEYVATVDNNLVHSFFNMLSAYIPVFLPPPIPGQPAGTIIPERQQIIADTCLPLCFMSLIWSVGASCDDASRDDFNTYLRDRMSEHGHADAMPTEKTVFDYCFRFSANPDDELEPAWVPWSETEPAFALRTRVRFSDILVPTTDTIRQNYVLKHLLLRNVNVAAVGPTGTGKSVSVNEIIMGGLPERYQGVAFTFSAQTSAALLQNSLMSKFDKRRSHVYGAPAGKQLIVFIDDANLPQKEVYGAQPPLELVRQFLGHGGFYQLQGGIKFNTIVDVSMIVAMGPPGGGRNQISNRVMRYFNFLAFPEMSDESKRTILNTILLGGFGLAGADAEISTLLPKLVNSTLSIFKKSCKAFLPTPNHVHYSFNMRDVMRVFSSIYESFDVKERDLLVRMWLHENTRVFGDRLIDDTDRQTFRAILDEELKEQFGYEKGFDEAVTASRLIFGDYCNDRRIYSEIADMAELSNRISDFLTVYNEENQPQMNLVMFLDAIEHVSRISRVLRMPNGHCLLLGMGGSGRKSMCRLAVSMCERMDLFTIEITKNFSVKDWRENIAKLVMGCGKDDKRVTFMFSDTQILKPIFMEDVGALLTSGDVPNLFDDKEIDIINEKFKGVCMSEGLPTSKIAMYSRFNKEVRSNLHIVLAFSPVGEMFRTRIRMFPALINCCTIDWFADWPAEALMSVGRAQLEGSGVQFDDDDQVNTISEIFTTLHQSATENTERFFEDTKRRTFVTPTSYLALISTFLKMLMRKRKFVSSQRSRLANGLDKLRETEERVAELEESLKAQQPILRQTQEEIKVMMSKLSVDREIAAEKEAVARSEEGEAASKAQQCSKIRRQCADRLEKAEPALIEAVKVIRELKPAQLSELSTYTTVGDVVRKNLEVVSILLNFGVCPKEYYSGPPGGKKQPDWFAVARSKLKNTNELLRTLTSSERDGGFEKDRMDDALMDKVRPYYESEDCTPARARTGSSAVEALCKWMRAMYDWFYINKEVIPLRKELAVSEEELAVVNNALAVTRAKLKEVVDNVKALQDQYDEAVARQKSLENEMELTTQKLGRAARLIDGLAGEKSRWIETVAVYDREQMNIVGNMLIAAGTVAYLGPLTTDYRRRLVRDWHAVILKVNVPCSVQYDPVFTVGDPVEIQGWQVNGLPTDSLSTENAIIMNNASTWPLLIDPQGQANAWIRNLHKENNLQVCKPSEDRYMKVIEGAVRLGFPCLLENVGESLDPALEPILLKQTYLIGSSPHIRVGDSVIPYDPNFRLYITTKLPNPRYAPETVVMVTLLNFFITPGGLEDQLLGKTVEKERKDLEVQKQQLTKSNAEKNKELKTLQDDILRMLQEAEGDILEQEVLINALEMSKKKSIEINEDLEKARVTEKNIDETRERYRPHAFRGALLFFCVSAISAVDPMYQFSLQWFMNLFNNCIDKAERFDEDVDKRIESIMDYTTYNFYCNVCRSLFEKHKLTFSFYLCNSITKEEGKLDADEIRFLLTGATKTMHEENPAVEWLNDQSWNEIQFISQNLPNFTDFSKFFKDNIVSFKAFFDSSDAHRFPLPAPWDSCSPLQRLILTRCLRMDKVSHGIQDFVTHFIGERYIIVPQFNLMDAYKDSDCCTPLIFIISPGSDPMHDLLKFAEVMRMSKKLDKVSLGQGQGRKAEELLINGKEKGQWVLLQNCHLATSWMPTLESIVEHFNPESIKKEFRLWLTSMPTASFPISVLQIGVKMTNEPPKGLRANLTRSFFGFKEDDLVHASKPNDFRRLLLAQCMFHGVIQERRRFGSLGFNIPYEFNDSDRNVCILQLRKFLDMYERIPFDVLVFLTGEINYGGRVTDDWDRRCVMTLIKDFIHQKVLGDGYTFSPLPTYVMLEPGNRNFYLDHFSSWPINPDPAIFGLHENADITSARNETREILHTVLSLQAGGSGGGSGVQSRDSQLTFTATNILRQLPDPFDIHAFQQKYPTCYDESMNTVLVQEAGRYNKLLIFMGVSLKEFLRAVKGEVGMSSDLEAMGNSLFINAVPQTWSKLAYPSLMPLSSWFEDLLKRVAFISQWYEKGSPNAFWIGGFFFPQAFLTGTLQNYARQVKEAIDMIKFGFSVMPPTKPDDIKRPENGAIIYGLFMEGARWSVTENSIVESRPKELFTDLPPVYLRPIVNKPPSAGVYLCPVYKTLTRAGTLSTTGHSTNFVLPIEIPTNVDAEHWIKRGVACIVNLNF